MDRWRQYDGAAIAAQVDAGHYADPVAYLVARMGEIEVPATAAGGGFDRLGQFAMP
jgi:hypothetical protein